MGATTASEGISVKLAVFGSGYVGLVTAACFAETGNHVICVDIDIVKIENLKRGIIPIFEPKLSDLITKNHREKNIDFTVDAKSAIESADIIFIAVGTPANKDGSADLTAVFNVVDHIAQYATFDKIIVIKSTVPIGTTDAIQQLLPNPVVFNPEFLKQGDAVSDCMKPDRIIIGTNSDDTTIAIKKLYRDYYSDEKKFLVMDTRSAEMTKYVANAMLATKISFINEMSQIADRVGADIHSVRDGIALDARIGPHFINPGMGYGGSCFPKDIKALQKTAENAGYHARMLQAIEDVNADQKLFLFDKIMTFYKDNLRGKIFAVWGLSFKPNTDDIRDASAIILIRQLWEQGATIQAYDPEAMTNFKKQFPSHEHYTLCKSANAALENADTLCIVTEWNEFKSPDFNLLSKKLSDRVIFDGRNILDKIKCREFEINYFKI